MSRKFMDEDYPSPSLKEEEYMPGTPKRDLGAVDKLVQLYLENSSAWLFDWDVESDIVSEIGSQIEAHGQSLLEDVINKLKKADQEHHFYSDQLLSPLVNILHEKGENQFTLDLQLLTPVQNVGSSIQGTHTKPLIIRYNLPNATPRNEWHGTGGMYCGTGAVHCVIGVSGEVRSVGINARYSTFYLDRPPKFLAHSAQDCTFYLQDVSKVLWDRADGKYKLTLKTPEGNQELMTGSLFYDNRNRIMISDGTRWKETKPSALLRMRNAVRKKVQEEGWDISDWQ